MKKEIAFVLSYSSALLCLDISYFNIASIHLRFLSFFFFIFKTINRSVLLYLPSFPFLPIFSYLHSSQPSVFLPFIHCLILIFFFISNLPSPLPFPLSLPSLLHLYFLLISIFYIIFYSFVRVFSLSLSLSLFVFHPMAIALEDTHRETRRAENIIQSKIYIFTTPPFSTEATDENRN